MTDILLAGLVEFAFSDQQRPARGVVLFGDDQTANLQFETRLKATYRFDDKVWGGWDLENANMKWTMCNGVYVARPYRVERPTYIVEKPEGFARWQLKRNDTQLGSFDTELDAMRAGERDHFARCVTVSCGGNLDCLPQDRVDRLIAAIESAGVP